MLLAAVLWDEDASRRTLVALAATVGAAGSDSGDGERGRRSTSACPMPLGTGAGRIEPSVLARLFRVGVLAVILAGWAGAFLWYQESQAAKPPRRDASTISPTLQSRSKSITRLTSPCRRRS